MFFPGHCETSPGVFLRPERIKESQDDLPPGELMLDGNFRVDLVYLRVLESKEDVIRSESYSQGSSLEQRTVVNFINDQINLG